MFCHRTIASRRSSFSRACAARWTALSFSTDGNCSNFCFHGSCFFSEDDSATCFCDEGWTGERCETDPCHNLCLNDGECSADWYNFQESLAQLHVLEEEVVDNHKKLLGNLENWVQQDYTLLTMTNEVDYDQDGELRLPFHGHMSEINLFQLIRNCWRRLSSKRK